MSREERENTYVTKGPEVHRGFPTYYNVYLATIEASWR